jgi:hypothetical protein
MLRHRSIILVALVSLACAPGALAQEFFMIFQGRVAASGDIAPASGDTVIATVGGQNFSGQVDPTGRFQGLTVIRTSNNPDPVTFRFRKGSTTYALVLAEGDTNPISVQYSGSSNPLGAAFNPTTVNGIIGPRISGGGSNTPGDGGSGGNEGDAADVDGDGLITTNDARLVLRFIIGMRQGVTDASVFDVTGDGVINTNDVVAILRREGEEAVVPDPPAEEEGA